PEKILKTKPAEGRPFSREGQQPAWAETKTRGGESRVWPDGRKPGTPAFRLNSKWWREESGANDDQDMSSTRAVVRSATVRRRRRKRGDKAEQRHGQQRSRARR